MNPASKAFLAASVIAFGLAGPIAASAQNSDTGGGAGANPAENVIAEPTQDQLQRYAKAVREVSAVAVEYQPRVQAAGTETEKQSLRVQADQEMVDRVEAGGMSVDEYNGISRAVQRDPALRQQVESMVQR